MATALRSVIRADDLLFRWGGDKFLAILWNMSEEDACTRFEHFGELLSQLESEASPITVFFGVAQFDDGAPLDHAIGVADSLMYGRKHQRSLP